MACELCLKCGRSDSRDAAQAAPLRAGSSHIAGEQAKDAAHAAHDLTADEDEPHGDTWGTSLAESRSPDDAASDLDQVAQAAFQAVERTFGSVESCEQPAPAPDAPGVVTSRPGAYKQHLKICAANSKFLEQSVKCCSMSSAGAYSQAMSQPKQDWLVRNFNPFFEKRSYINSISTG